MRLSQSDRSTDVEPDANNNSQPDLSDIPGLFGGGDLELCVAGATLQNFGHC